MSATTSSEVREEGLLIGGAWRPAERTFERRNPARPDEVVGRSARATAADVSDAFDAALEARAAWRRTPAPARGAILRRAGDLVEQRAEEIAVGLAREEGKAIRDARGEVLRAAQVLRFHGSATEQPIGEVYASAAPGTLLQTVREPLGVVTVITPWNFPIAIPAWKIAPALAYGNTVVWKPAEIASGTAVRLAEALVEAGLPDGVLNLVTGKGSEIGDALVADDRAAGVTFTGSNEVGARIREIASQRGAKLQLELGGKNPGVVLAGADLERTTGCIVRSAMLSTGQRCTAMSRAIVVDELHDELVDRLVAAAQALRTGDPLDEQTDIGPLASAAQHRTVRGYLELAPTEGAATALGGEAGDGAGGYFVEPTIYTDVDPSSRIATEEIFGPVLCVIRARDADEAIALANDTRFGLSASLFTRDVNDALRLAGEIEAGVVHVNGESAGAEPHVPFGGVKASSGGSREQGMAAREFFTEVKTIYVEGVL
jgi:aldehyde dehydrogenase (NAD+)